MSKKIFWFFWAKRSEIRPLMLWQVCADAFTARSTLWEWKGNSGRSSFVPFRSASCRFWSEKSSVRAGSQMPLWDKLISCDQWVASVSMFVRGVSRMTYPRGANWGWTFGAPKLFKFWRPKLLEKVTPTKNLVVKSWKKKSFFRFLTTIQPFWQGRS